MMESTNPASGVLLVEQRGAELWVTLNRPDQRNALSAELIGALSELIGRLPHERSVRTVVLRGAGGSFCAGGDIGGFKQGATIEKAQIAATNRQFGELLTRLSRLPQTTVSAVEGAAFGGGIGLMCATDVTVVTSDARMAVSELRIGVIPAQIAPFLVARVGMSNARRLALTGEIVDGDAARLIGLAHDVAPKPQFETRLEQLLQRIDGCAPQASARTKELLMAVGSVTTDALLDRASELFADQVAGPEAQEGAAAFLEKRRAAWRTR